MLPAAALLRVEVEPVVDDVMQLAPHDVAIAKHEHMTLELVRVVVDVRKLCEFVPGGIAPGELNERNVVGRICPLTTVLDYA